MFKILLLSSATTIILFFNMILPQKKTTIHRAGFGGDLNYRLVEKKHFENLYDILFLPDDETGLSKPGIIVYSKKDRLSPDKIVDYLTGKVIIEDIDVSSRLCFSDNLKYIGIRKTLMMPKLETMLQPGKTLFQLFNRDGNKLFETEDVIWYDTSGKDFQITNKGYVLKIDWLSGSIEVLDNSGNQRLEEDFRSKSDPGGGHYIDISEDGQLIALALTDADSSGVHSKAILTDIYLNIIIEQRLDYKTNISGINISPSKEYLITSCAEYKPEFKAKTYIFNILDKKVNIIDKFYAGQPKFFSEDLILCKGLDKLRLYDLNLNKSLLEYKHNQRIFAFNYAPEKELIFTLEGTRRGGTVDEPYWYSSVGVNVFNLNRVSAFKLNLGNIHFKNYRIAPFLSCSNDASEFILQIGDDIYKYRTAK